MNCIICSNEFLSKRKDNKCCSIECKKIHRNNKQRKKYSTLTTSKKCLICFCEFEGTAKQNQCSKCRCIRRIKETKSKPVYCHRCKESIVKYKKVKTLHIDKIFSRGLCSFCKTKSKEEIYKRMISNKNPVIQKNGRKKIFSKEEKEEKKCKHIERMKNDNPTYREDVKEKIKNTRSQRKYNYKRGESHPLWKGNRDRAQTIRSRLYNIWVRPILERDNYTCSKCRIYGKKLEVHHIVPFRFILEKILNGRILKELSNFDFEILSNEIERIHKEENIEGITFCVKCHIEEDERRR